jgi:hypothetical protein
MSLSATVGAAAASLPAEVGPPPAQATAVIATRPTSHRLAAVRPVGTAISAPFPPAVRLSREYVRNAVRVQR